MGGIKTFRRKFFVLQCRNFSKGNTSVVCLRKLPVSKNSMDRMNGIKIFRRKFFVPQCRTFWQGVPFVLCFRETSGSEKEYG